MFPEGTPDLQSIDLQSILQQAAQMQEQLLSAQQQLEDARIDGSAGGGLVSATVTGAGELVSLQIDPSVCDPADTETLADLVVAAVHNAADNARHSAADSVGDITGGLDDVMGEGLKGLLRGPSPTDPADAATD